MVFPTQTGLFVVIVGVAKALLTTTDMEAGWLVQLPELTVKVYVPALADVKLVMLGFC